MIKIQFRRDTGANWTLNNPILALGELGLETDTGRFKLGDGVSEWDALVYASGVPGVSISSIAKTSGTGAAGSTDTYTITLSNGNTSTFNVYNGANGADGVDSSKLPLNGGTMTGAITSFRETAVAMVDNNINLAAGNLFSKTFTASTTLTISDVPTTGQVISFILELTNGGAYPITWFSGIKWTGGIAPVLTASGLDILGFYTKDGGITWRGLVLSKDNR